MGEDMNKKIQQIAELLSQENMPENVKSLLSLLSGSLENKESTGDTVTQAEEVKIEKPVQNSHDNDSDLLKRVGKIAGNLSAGNDPRINLLYAIKPFMNSKRQKKLGNCIQLLQISSLARLLDNQDK